MTEHFRYPFPKDPGAQVKTASVLFQVTLEDGRQVTYTGHATRADFEEINGAVSLDMNSPSGIAQRNRTTIDWVTGAVHRTDNLAEWGERLALENPRPELEPECSLALCGTPCTCKGHNPTHPMKEITS